MKKCFGLVLCFSMIIIASAHIQAKEAFDNMRSDASEIVQLENSTDILVAYFSCTGNTEPLAEYVSEIMKADLYEITPEVPYTEDDIAYMVDDCRANIEQDDDSCRPAISGEPVNIQNYNVVFIAFPIWWGKEPRIIDTFMESYDFSGKTLIPFCTSGSSGITTAENNLHAITDDTVQWLEGSRFRAGASKEDVEEWIDDLEVLD